MTITYPAGCRAAAENETAIDQSIDANLLQRITKRDQQAFEALYYRYRQRLARFIFRVGGASLVHDEIINDTLYTVWNNAATFNGTSRPSTWIFGIAYNKVLKALKTQYREQPEFDSELAAAAGDVYSGDAPNHAERLESENWFARAFALLPPEQRATVELTFYHDMSYQEIAALMQCSENTVKTRMFHARKKLQTILPHLADGKMPAQRRGEEG